MAKTYDHLVKLLLIGDSDVGKTSLLFRFSEDSFNGTFVPEIGMDFKIRQIDLDGKRIKLQIWDTAGQERFRTITNAHYRGASGILFVYDVTNERSFRNIRSMIQEVQEHASSEAEMMILGNRCDADDTSRQVSRERGEQLAREFNCMLTEVSDKTGHNVDEAFFTFAKEIMDKIEV